VRPEQWNAPLSEQLKKTVASTMSRIPNDGNYSATLKTYKGRTTGTAACNVKGALSFARARHSGFFYSLARLLRLKMPEQFTYDVDVYGTNGATLETLKRDSALRNAVETLLTSGATNVSLGGSKIRAEFPRRGSPENADQVKTALVRVAQSLEMQSGGVVNAEASIAKVSLPFMLFAAAGFAALMGSGFLNRGASLINMFDLLPAVLVTALGLLAIAGLAGSSFLRKHALAAAALPVALTLTCFAVPLLAMAACSMINISLGRARLPDSIERVTGYVAQLHTKGHPCVLEFMRPSALDLYGRAVRQVPISCLGYHGLSGGVTALHLYELRTNPGFLGAPFVDREEQLPDESEGADPN
jgi:hypothetical protein